MLSTQKLKDICQDLTVLIVDDEDDAREQLVNILNILFPEVLSAANGEDALTLYKEHKVDLIITDLTMPKMDGFTLIDAVYEIDPKQRIIVMSAHTESNITVKAIKLGVDGYILKPIEANQMLESINKAVLAIQNEKEIISYQNDLETKIDSQTKEIIHQLECDSLTGLYNKEKLNMDFIQSKFQIIMMLDIDNFSHINGAYGDYYGDLLLREVGAFLEKITGKTVYKGYSDEYYIALDFTKDEALALANDIKMSVYHQAFDIEVTHVRITFTIALVTIEEEDTKVPYNKLHNTITDMRKLHKNIIGFYQSSSKVQDYHKEMYEWAYKTKVALDEDKLVPFFQPIVNVQTGAIEKYECLARIIDDNKVISPYFFIEPAKVAGMVSSITRRIIKKSFEAFSKTTMEFSINITDDDFKENYLVDYLEGMSAFYNIDPHQVVLEILENISDYDAKYAIEQIDALKGLGFQIAIDDFGAESSNFSRLQKLNTDYIKIDGSFIKDIATNLNSLIIVETIIYYAKRRDIKVIAEFVHDEATYNKVKQLDIDYIQGYYFSEPKQKV